VYQNFYTQFSGQFDAAVSAINGLASTLSGPLLALATLYVMVWGYLLATGRIQELLSDTTARVVRVVIIGALVTNTATYDSLVGSFFLNTVPCFVMSAVGSAACGGNGVESAGPTLVGAADQLFSAGMKAGMAAAKNANLLSVDGLLSLIVAGIGLLATIAASLLVFFEITLILTVLKIVVFVGPIFIALALFERTGNFFMSWVGRVAHSLIEILLVVLASQVLSAVVLNATAPNQTNPIVQALASILAVLIGMALFLVIPSLAGSLSGSGGSLTTAMLAASRGFSWSAGAARSAGRGLAAGAGAARGAMRGQR
jgi:type IV secretion system protein VirB6